MQTSDLCLWYGPRVRNKISLLFGQITGFSRDVGTGVHYGGTDLPPFETGGNGDTGALTYVGVSLM